MSIITNNLALAIDYLHRGEIVAIPTETVYGLAGNAEDSATIHKIYVLKNRPLTHPLIMHIAQKWDLSHWVRFIPHYVPLLIDHFWPGPLTLVFTANATVNRSLTGGQPTVAIRCPNHPLTQEILHQLNFPLVAPSANPFGKISPTTAEHVQHSFPEENLLILDGGRCIIGIESTIIDATHPQHYQILRRGYIDEAQLEKVAPNNKTTISNIRAPGRLAQHYQPEKPLFYFSTQEDLRRILQQYPTAYLLTFHDYGCQNYRFAEDPIQAAYELYYQLRIADQSNLTPIAVELPPTQKKWEAIRERLVKAGNMF